MFIKHKYQTNTEQTESFNRLKKPLYVQSIRCVLSTYLIFIMALLVGRRILITTDTTVIATRFKRKVLGTWSCTTKNSRPIKTVHLNRLINWLHLYFQILHIPYSKLISQKSDNIVWLLQKRRQHRESASRPRPCA